MFILIDILLRALFAQLFEFLTIYQSYCSSMLIVYKQSVFLHKGKWPRIGAGHLSQLASVCTVLFMYFLHTCTCTYRKLNKKIKK